MIRNTSITRWFPSALALTVASSLLADTVQVGGPPRPGHARPPLHINLTPSVSTSSTTVQVIGNNTGSDAGWALETALDVEWAHAIAPGATIILSVAASNGSGDLLNAVDAAVNAGATVVSMSWGGPEFSGMSSYDNHFNRPNVTFTASSGDNGAGVEWPAVSPYVIGVGGTSAGAPQWAALIALANDLRAKNGSATLTSANSILYPLAQGSTIVPYTINAAYFYDVSQGNNGGYNAGPTYDFVTGLGSPVAAALVPALAPSSQTPDFSLSASPASTTVSAGTSASYPVSVATSGGFS